MLKRARDPNRIEILQGALDLVLLQALQWSPPRGHGHRPGVERSGWQQTSDAMASLLNRRRKREP